MLGSTYVQAVISSASDSTVTTEEDESGFVSFPAAVLREMIMKTYHAMWRGDSQDVFSGLYLFSVENSLIVAATDGRRISKIRREFQSPLPFKDGVILPARAGKKLVRLHDACQNTSVSYDDKDKRIHFRVGNVDLICKIIDGEFPDYEHVIPEKLDHKIRFNRIALQKAIRQAASRAIKPARQVHLKFTSGKVSFQAGTFYTSASESTGNGHRV